MCEKIDQHGCADTWGHGHCLVHAVGVSCVQQPDGQVLATVITNGTCHNAGQVHRLEPGTTTLWCGWPTSRCKNSREICPGGS